MFWKRKRSPAYKPPPADTDSELNAYRATLARRQETIAELELDLLNSQTELAEFNAELERRIGPLQRRLEAVQAELKDARLRASRQVLWGDRASSPEIPEDVSTQYDRLWGPERGPRPEASPPSAAAPPPADEQLIAQLKLVYRALAKRFHPDLSPDPSEKAWREHMMGRINAAYHAQDLAALRQFAGEQSPPAAAPAAPKTRAQVIAELQAEIERLDELAASLEQQLDDLAKSPAVRLKLDAVFARRAGRDLVAELAAELQSDLARAEKELASLR
jgi:predicted  nucleic acid-binding Zn-ribbon protein